jgi:hypothetical protein
MLTQMEQLETTELTQAHLKINRARKRQKLQILNAERGINESDQRCQTAKEIERVRKWIFNSILQCTIQNEIFRRVPR